ncbi:MAG: ABC transporter substrate-binding protein [Alphaproteobacteria bacterium]|nr:ABC transporter substrate-binding protein [Alphaproteobacteria bacterium]
MSPGRLIRSVVVAVALLVASGAQAAPAADASAFVVELGEEAVRMLGDKSLTEEQRIANFRRLLNKGFDLRTIGRFVLGRHARQAAPEQLAEYERLFAEFIVKTYATRLGQYEGEQLRVLGAAEDGDSDVMVRSEILVPDGPPVLVDWRVREHEGAQHIVDVAIEGVSMAITQRDEFAAVIQQRGSLAGLNDALRAKIGE